MSALRRALIFAAIFGILQLGWQALSGGVVHRAIVNGATVGVATRLVNALTPAVHATAVGTTVHAMGGGLNIINGCDGTETWFLLCAAFAVAPLKWRARLAGLALGTLLVFAVNQARILALFYANRSDPEVFNLLHAIVGPIVVILAVASFFYVWITHYATCSARPA